MLRAAATIAATLGLVTFGVTGTGHAATVSQFSFTTPQYVPGVATSAAPSMVECANGAVYMVWKGMDTDEHLYYSNWTSSGWAPQKQIQLGNLTDLAPSAACDDGYDGSNLLLVAWKGLGSDNNVYVTTETAGADNWSSAQQIAGATTDTSPAAGMIPSLYEAPRVVQGITSPQYEEADTPYLAWKVAGSSSVSVTHSVNGVWGSAANLSWINTDSAPTMSNAFGGIQHVALTWKEAGTDNMKYSVGDANDGFTLGTYLGGGGGTETGLSSATVEMANSSNDLVSAPFAVWKGLGADDDVWFATQANSPSWADQAPLPFGSLTATMPTTASYTYTVPPPPGGFAGPATGVLVAWRGIGNDSGIHFTVETLTVLS